MKTLLLSSLLLATSVVAQTEQPLLTTESSQFISYWKPHVIDVEDDARVAVARQVFQRLLRGWDSARLAPALYVVDDRNGPWAASLVDGNILLSQQALDVIDRFGDSGKQDLLAFMLAHEIAHQRADDLWQHRFFNLDQQSTPTAQNTAPMLDQHTLEQLEQTEMHADHDGLILMASVGFDPFQVVGQKDFFTVWVENIWRQPCQGEIHTAMSQACQQARKRMLNSLAQLETVASQSSLYQLGVQAMVAQDYPKARQYLAQFGRDFPSRAVLTALGLSYLLPAIEEHRKAIEQGMIDAPALFFPVLLDHASGAENLDRTLVDKRAAKPSQAQKRIQLLAQQAADYFDKAIRLSPNHKSTYLLLANSYILQNNPYLVRGVLQGRFIPQFGADPSVSLLLAMTDAIEGQRDDAIASMQKLLRDPQQQSAILQPDWLQFSLSWNLSSLLRDAGKTAQAREVWKHLAKRAQRQGNGYLFQLALAQIRPPAVARKAVLKQAPTINGLRLGNRKTRDDSAHSIREVWIEGEQYHVYHYQSGTQFITGADGRIVSARQQTPGASLEGLLALGDPAERALKVLGLPDRRLPLVSGEYLVYDPYGLALRIDNDRIEEWFLYR